MQLRPRASRSEGPARSLSGRSAAHRRWPQPLLAHFRNRRCGSQRAIRAAVGRRPGHDRAAENRPGSSSSGGGRTRSRDQRDHAPMRPPAGGLQGRIARFRGINALTLESTDWLPSNGFQLLTEEDGFRIYRKD